MEAKQRCLGMSEVTGMPTHLLVYTTAPRAIAPLGVRVRSEKAHRSCNSAPRR